MPEPTATTTAGAAPSLEDLFRQTDEDMAAIAALWGAAGDVTCHLFGVPEGQARAAGVMPSRLSGIAVVECHPYLAHEPGRTLVLVTR